MGLLDKIQKGKRLAPRRVLLYGTGGIGKSTFGAEAPDSVFIGTESGLDDIDCSRLPEPKSFAQTLQLMGELYTEDHGFKTLCIDSLDWLERLIWDEVCERKHVQSIEDLGFGKGYILALGLWREFIAGLSGLRENNGMMIILIAHSKVEVFKNPEGDDFDRYMPKLHKLAGAVFQEWCDEVLFATYKTYTADTQESFGKKVGKGTGGKERVLKTVEAPAHIAKNRLGLPSEIPFSWASYASFLNANSKKEGV